MTTGRINQVTILNAAVDHRDDTTNLIGQSSSLKGGKTSALRTPEQSYNRAFRPSNCPH
jgi:hypothetical protein